MIKLNWKVIWLKVNLIEEAAFVANGGMIKIEVVVEVGDCIDHDVADWTGSWAPLDFECT